MIRMMGGAFLAGFGLLGLICSGVLALVGVPGVGGFAIFSTVLLVVGAGMFVSVAMEL